MEKVKENGFDTFEIVLLVIFGLIIVSINVYSEFVIKLPDDWLHFSFDGSVYFFFALLIWLDKSRDEKTGITFWPTFFLIFLELMILSIFFFLLKNGYLPMPHGFSRYGLQFIFVVCMSFLTVILCQKLVGFLKQIK